VKGEALKAAAKLLRKEAKAAAKKLGGTKAERMARAAEQGYDTRRVLYHGSPKENITQFRLGPHDETAINSLSLTNDPGYAEKYALGGYGRHGYDYIDPSTGKFSEWVGESGASPTTYPVYVRGKTPDFMEAVDIYEAKHGPNTFQRASPEDFAKSMGEEGITGVSMFGDEVAMLDPAAIRSVNADFNPANRGKSDLLGSARPDLLAGIAGVSGVTAAALKGKMDADKHGSIEAPKNPKALMLANAIRDLDRRTKGSPANLLVPTSTGEFLSNVGYNQKTSTKDKLLAALEWLP
jgi:hypothetical protein